jgi:hypothetical protein
MVKRYDAGLLSDYGGGNVEWWQDYLRAEIERCNDHWEAEYDDLEEKIRWAAKEKELLELEIQQNGDFIKLLEEKVQRLEGALREIANELGVPQPGYPAPVANAARIALKGLEQKK